GGRFESGAPRPKAPPTRARRAAVVLLLAAAVLGVGAALYRILGPGEARDDVSNGTAQEVPPWKPRPPLTLEELAKLPSPLDALKRAAMGLPGDAPPELLAVLGDHARFPLPAQTTAQLQATHWMAQTGDGRLLAVPWW